METPLAGGESGVPEKVAMQMTEHRTRKVFDQYHIISPGDLRQANRKLTEPGNGYTSGHSGDDGITSRMKLDKPRTNRADAAEGHF